MAYDPGDEAVALLESGVLPELPTHVEPGRTFPVALDVWGDVGAVLFFRRWRNGAHDDDTVVCERVDGRWEPPAGYGGGAGGSFDELYQVPPPTDGWDGAPVLWLGVAQQAIGDEDSERWVVVIEGLAAPPVVAVRAESGDLTRLVPVDSPCGAFVAIVPEGDGVRAWAVDAAGEPVIGADGTPLVFAVPTEPVTSPAASGGAAEDSAWSGAFGDDAGSGVFMPQAEDEP